MYFITSEDAPDKKSNVVPISKSPLSTNDIKPETDSTSCENNNTVKRIYGRARANLCFSSFYIFCEDFRKQLEYLYSNSTETCRKNMLNYMWKHLNVRDKHKYYETATKARTMYNLPEHLYPTDNDQQNSGIKSTVSNSCNNLEVLSSKSTNVIGKLVKVKFSKSRTNPIITPLKIQDIFNNLESEHDQQQDEVYSFGEEELSQDNSEIPEHQDNSAEHLQLPLDHCDDQGIEEQWLSDGNPIITKPGTFYPTIPSSPIPTDVSTITITSDQQVQEPIKVEGSTYYVGHSSSGGNSPEIMLQQYQQQPDYTPYGGIGYGAQPNAGYFNYAATESSWYGSPSSGGDHTQMHNGLSHNACNTHIGDSTGNFLNHGYHQTTSTGVETSTAESFTSNNHPVSQADMDPMADFLGGHQNMDENDKIKEESIDWLSTIINDEVDHSNRQDGSGDGGGGGGGGGAGNGSKLSTGDLPCKGQEANGRLPNFHQAFGSTEIGRFSQHEYYEPPKDSAIGECQSGSQAGSVTGPGNRVTQPDEQPPVASFEPPRQQNRRGRTQRGGGQHRRNKQTRAAAAAAAAAAAVAAQQYVGYDVTGSVSGAGGRHQVPPYHQDPYSRNQHAQQRYHQEYHHHHQQQSSSYQNHQQEYYRPYDRMHYQQPPPPPNQYYNREQTYPGGYNRFHSCCSTEHIARPNHHNYGQGQYYGDYNTYNQW